MDNILREFLALDVPESMCDDTKKFVYEWLKKKFTAHNSAMDVIALLSEMVTWLKNHSHFPLSPELLVWQHKADLYCRMQQHQ